MMLKQKSCMKFIGTSLSTWRYGNTLWQAYHRQAAHHARESPKHLLKVARNKKFNVAHEPLLLSNPLLQLQDGAQCSQMIDAHIINVGAREEICSALLYVNNIYNDDNLYNCMIE